MSYNNYELLLYGFKMIVIIDFQCDAMLPAGLKDAGGGNIYSKGILENLSKLHYNTVYITEQKYANYPYHENFSNSCEIYRIDKKHITEEKILNILKNYEDISVIHGIYWTSAELSIKIASKFKVPFIFSPTSNYRKKAERGAFDINSQLRDNVEMDAFNFAKIILCGSSQEADDIARLYKIAKEKLLICGLTVSESFEYPDYDLYGNCYIKGSHSLIKIDSFPIRPLYSNEILMLSKKAFTFFGRLHVDKGILQILLAWKKIYDILQSETPPLWIIGGGLDDITYFHREFLSNMSWITKVENEHKIIWWGNLSHASISLLLTKTLATVSHSRYETAGTFIIESLAHGVPVIATPFGYGKDYIFDYLNGFSVDFNDVDKLSMRLYQFARQPILSQILGESALDNYKTIIKHYNFLNTHLFAYGLTDQYQSEGSVCFATRDKSAIDGREINAYPTNSTHFSDEYIIEWISTHCQTLTGKITEINKINNDFIFTANSKTYIAKKINAKIDLDSIYNINSKKNLVYDINNQLYSLQLLGQYGEMFDTVLVNSSIGLYVAELKAESESTSIIIPPNASCLTDYFDDFILGLSNLAKLLNLTKYVDRLTVLKKDYKNLKRIDESLPAIIVDKLSFGNGKNTLRYDANLLTILPIMQAIIKCDSYTNIAHDIKAKIGNRKYNKLFYIYKNTFEINEILANLL